MNLFYQDISRLDMIGVASDTIHMSLEAKSTLILLKGNLGSGKTYLVNCIISLLTDKLINVQSPTFSILNTYNLDGKKINHLDLYRLKSLEEFMAMGFGEMLNCDLNFIEWPQLIESEVLRFVDNAILIDIIFGKTDEMRDISISLIGLLANKEG